MIMNKIAGFCLSGLLTFFAVTPLFAQDVKRGDSRESVLEKLGNPRGRLTSGDYEVYTYERGKIELRNGHVVEVDLISAAEAETLRVAKEKRLMEIDVATREAAERRRVEGPQILNERLTNTYFRSLPAGDQLAYWDSFKKLYPEVDASGPYTDVARQYQTELEQARIRAQLAELQQRTAEAEARAARAEAAAAEARQAAQNQPVITYINPVWVPTYTPPQSYHRACDHNNCNHLEHKQTSYDRDHNVKSSIPRNPDPQNISNSRVIRTIRPTMLTNTASSIKSDVIFK